MNNTALRAEAQSANNTHMVFVNEEQEKFNDIKSRYIKTRVQRQSKIGFHQCWQTIGSIRVISFLLALIRTEHQVLTIIRAGTIR